VAGVLYKFEIIDTGGQERFRTLYVSISRLPFILRFVSIVIFFSSFASLC
jgi:GTPase SAR1 family protein